MSEQDMLEIVAKDTQKQLAYVASPLSAEHINAMLKIALAANNLVIEQDWMPIDTAPKDGSDIFIKERGGRVQIARWVNPSMWEPDWYVQLTQLLGPDSYPTLNVTHWKPITAPKGDSDE
jgi:hypothetical protein